MAGEQISLWGSSSITVTELIEGLDASFVGKLNISMTNMSTTSVPAIAAGSVSEIGGSLYRFSTEEPISTSGLGSTTSMTYYINLVPSSSEVTAQFSSVSPSWRDDYQGWYYSTSSVYKTVARTYFDGTNYPSTTKYYFKQTNPYFPGDVYIEDDITCDDLYCDDIINDNTHSNSFTDINSAGNVLSSGYFNSVKGRWPTASLHGSYTRGQMFTAMSSSIPNTNDEMLLIGHYEWSTGQDKYTHKAVRVSSGRIDTYSDDGIDDILEISTGAAYCHLSW